MAYSYIFTETRPLGDANKNWYTVGIDADGSHLLTVDSDTGKTYASTNGGTSWFESLPFGVALTTWHPRTLSISDDGSKFAAGINYAYVYTSQNSGASWAQKFAYGSGNRDCKCAIDADCTNLIASINNVGVYTSSNSGTNWTLRINTTDKLSSVASDGDGSNLLVCRAGTIYLSTNSGVNWNSLSITSSLFDIDSSGTIIVYATLDKIYLSTNTGSNFSEIQPTGTTWRRVKISSDGQTIVALHSSGNIYFSLNQGSTWNSVAPFSSFYDNSQNSLDISSDGTKIIVSTFTNGRIFTGILSEVANLSIIATNGTVAKNPSTTSYALGTSVILTPTPNEGYIFSSWSGDASGSDNPLTITMDADKTITANFVASTYVITSKGKIYFPKHLLSASQLNKIILKGKIFKFKFK